MQKQPSQESVQINLSDYVKQVSVSPLEIRSRGPDGCV